MSKQNKLLKISLLGLLIWLPLEVNASSLIISTVKNPDPYSGNQSWFRYYESAGSTINDAIELNNPTNQIETIKLYATDATSNQAGSFTPKMDTDPQLGLGLWTTLEKNSVTLAPNQSTEIKFSIQIPKDTPPGQYFGGIINEEDNSAVCDLPETVNGFCQGNIQIKTRTGNRVYLTIPGEVKQDIKMTGFTWKIVGKNHVQFLFNFENKGNVSFQPKAYISIYDSWGNQVTTLENVLGKSLPGTTITPIVDWLNKGVFGTFKAKAEIYYQQDDLGQFDNLHGTVLSEHGELSLLIFPWTAAIWIFSFLILIGAAFLVRSYYYYWLAKHCETYEVQDGDNLLEIAKRFNAKWQLIACINKLKAPYSLKDKTHLKIPHTPKKQI